jgi:hypothetical protein
MQHRIAVEHVHFSCAFETHVRAVAHELQREQAVSART